MAIAVRESLKKLAETMFGADAPQILSYLPTATFCPAKIKAIMINEVVADTPDNDFYSKANAPAYMETTLALFQKAGADVKTIEDITELGVYITSAVKLPKGESTIETATVKKYVPFLEEELALFPEAKAVMLMGDVARKALNMIAKARTGKNAVPSISTYKLRHSETYYGETRIFPAYIMTGKNILIEKSKVEMSAQEIAKMLKYIGGKRVS